MISPEENAFRESVIKHCAPLDPLFRAVSKDNNRKTPLVAGGAMRSIYNISIGEEDTIKDFDVYFPNHEMYLDALEFCTNNYKPSKQPLGAKNLAFDICPGIPPIQLIQEYYVENPTELYERFDWTCVMAAYNGSFTVMHSDFVSSNNDRELRIPFSISHYILMERGPIQLISRAMKYASKGYYLPLESMKKIIDLARQSDFVIDDEYNNCLNS